MPPRRISLNQEDIGSPQTILLQSAPNIFVGDFLKNNYWDMAEKLESNHECSICLDNINCKNCFTVLTCGHIFHLSCVIKCSPLNCPLCRSHQSSNLQQSGQTIAHQR